MLIESKKHERENWIDALKGIATLLIVAVHTYKQSLPSTAGVIVSHGMYGVQAFFLITALLAYKSMSYHFNEHTFSLNSIFLWWQKKIIRILPLYYLSLGVGILCGGNSYWLGSMKRISAGNIISHLLLVHGFFPRYCDSIMGVEWYIGDLVIFYLFAPLLYKLINSPMKSIILLIGAVIFSYITNDIFVQTIPNTADKYIYVSYYGTFCFFQQFPVMCIGIVAYFICKKQFNLKIKSKEIVTYILLFFIAIMVYGMISGFETMYIINEYTLISIWFFAIVICMKIYPAKIIDNSVFQVIGKYSYGIYLFHFYIKNVIDTIVYKFIPYNLVTYVFCFLIVVIFSYLFSKFLTEHVEKKLVMIFNKMCIELKRLFDKES